MMKGPRLRVHKKIALADIGGWWLLVDAQDIELNWAECCPELMCSFIFHFSIRLCSLSI